MNEMSFEKLEFLHFRIETLFLKFTVTYNTVS